MNRIIVASGNPVKIAAVKRGFEMMFPKMKFVVSGIKVESGVSNQPMTNEETLKGAVNRVNQVARVSPDADYWIGIEGGAEEENKEIMAFAWVVVKSKNGKWGKARTGTFQLPEKVASLVRKGIEMGEADDIVFKKKNSKQKNGAVGILTKNVIDRTNYYALTIVLALIPFKNKKLY